MSKEEAATEEKRTVGKAVLEAMLDGATNEEALERVKEEFPEAKTSPSSISWYRNNFRQEGHDIPTARELKKAERERKAKEAAEDDPLDS